MLKKILSGVVLAGLFTGVSFAAAPKHGHGDDPVLPSGQYSAKAKSLVCGGCGSMMEKTLRGLPGIETAEGEPKTGRVDFTVKKGEKVKWSELQKALKESSDKMGMGADFTLSDFKVVQMPDDEQ